MPAPGNVAVAASAARKANKKRGDAEKSTRLLDDDGAAGNSSVAVVQQQVDQVRTQMQDNINVVLENMERASDLEGRTEELAAQARSFHRAANDTRRMMWCATQAACVGMRASAQRRRVEVRCQLVPPRIRSPRPGRWKQCKQKLIIGGGCVTFVVVLILIIAGQNGAFDHKKDGD